MTYSSGMFKKDSDDLNFYQIISLAALYYFNKLNLNLWVLEIGMGGRLDPMNSLEPDISVITKVALDHQEFLGDTIEDIAAENNILTKTEPVFTSSEEKIEENDSMDNISEDDNLNIVEKGEFSAEESETSEIDDEFNQETEEELLDIPTFLRRQAN